VQGGGIQEPHLNYILRFDFKFTLKIRIIRIYMQINVIYKPVLQFTTKFYRQKILKVIKKEEILLAIGADLSSSYVEYLTGCRKEKIL
jgi:hypothetical protein